VGNSIGPAEFVIILLVCLVALAVVGGIGFLIFSQVRAKQRSSAMVKCPHCGKDIVAGMRFCPHCGGSTQPPVSQG